MVPAAWVELDELPLTPSGKVDRRSLPEPEQLRPELEQAFVAPHTAAEEVVAGIWAEVLGVERVGVEDNFFELGGHSLLVTQVVSRVVKVFQMDVPLRSLFESPTVSGVVEVLSGLWGSREAVEEIAQTYIEVGQLTDENVEELLAQMKMSN
jgi:acyl carrier protein